MYKISLNFPLNKLQFPLFPIIFKPVLFQFIIKTTKLSDNKFENLNETAKIKRKIEFVRKEEKKNCILCFLIGNQKMKLTIKNRILWMNAEGTVYL